jgi:hypothetical protein
MSDKLLIEQLTAQVEVEKTAEEHEIEKLAHISETIDQSQTLVAVGEQMFKIAEQLENDNLKALATDTYHLGERMGACLSKTASEDGSAFMDSLEIAEDLNKVASVYAEIADDAKDEDFSKLAEAVIEVSNSITDEANEVLEGINKQAEEAGITLDETEISKEAGVKETASALLAKLRALGGKAKSHVETAAHEAKEKVVEGGKKVHEFAKDHKKEVAYGAAGAAGLAAAGYGAKKMHDKK